MAEDCSGVPDDREPTDKDLRAVEKYLRPWPPITDEELGSNYVHLDGPSAESEDDEFEVPKSILEAMGDVTIRAVDENIVTDW